MRLVNDFSIIGTVRARIPMPRGGSAIMMGFPGLETAVDGSAYIDPVTQADTIGAITASGAEVLIILAEAVELPEGAFGQLTAAMESTGIETIFMPIEDFCAPSSRFIADWDRLLPQLQNLLDRDGTCAFCCQYGAGRSGLVASLLLMERGMNAEGAITLVREHFEEAVESDVQHAWLTAYKVDPQRINAGSGR